MSRSTVEGTLTRLNLSASGWFLMYPVRSVSGIQPETSWTGSVVTPRRGTMFGCAKFFHTAAIWWKAWGSLGPKHGETVIKTHHLECLRVSAGAHSYTLNPYL